jgi:hypothetical protein
MIRSKWMVSLEARFQKFPDEADIDGLCMKPNEFILVRDGPGAGGYVTLLGEFRRRGTFYDVIRHVCKWEASAPANIVELYIDPVIR